MADDETGKSPPPPVLHSALDMGVGDDGASTKPGVGDDEASTKPPPEVLHPTPDMDTVDGTSKEAFLPHELTVAEILVRLPVKSLMRFKCVSHAWHASISGDASFSEEHTRRLLRQNRRPSCLLMTPFITDRDGELDEFAVPGLWLWDENQRQHGVAALLHEMDWFAAEDREQRRLAIAHCDGLVMLADPEGAVRVLNPATRRSITLPPIPVRSNAHKAFGFGRDLRSGFYKVAHYFKRDTGRLGMEVFTIGEDGTWRDIDAEPPHPFLPGRTAVLFNGTLVWTVDHLYATQFNTDARFVGFSLDDEAFTAIDAPQWYSWLGYEQSRLTILAELHGELGLVRVTGDSQEIWVCDGLDYRPFRICEGYPFWLRRRVLHFSHCLVQPVAAFEDGIVFRDTSYCFGQLTKHGSTNLFTMNALHYRDPAGRFSGLKFHAIDVVAYTPTLASV